MHFILPLKMQIDTYIWNVVFEGMYLPTNNWIIQLEFERVLIKATFN